MALKEVCIAARDSDSGNTREGDIIVVREPLGYVGKREQHDFIWLLMDDADLPDPARLRGGGDQLIPTKHRYQIPLANLTGLDPVRARDRTDRYQPFVTVDQTMGTLRNPQTRRAVYVEKL